MKEALGHTWTCLNETDDLGFFQPTLSFGFAPDATEEQRADAGGRPSHHHVEEKLREVAFFNDQDKRVAKGGLPARRPRRRRGTIDKSAVYPHTSK